MGELTVNGELSFTFPDRFRIMSEAEMDSMYRDSNHDRAGILDETNQTVVVVFWHKAGRFVSKLAGSKEICRASENRISKRLSKFGYVFDGFYERKICGLDAYGFRHRYVRQGIEYTSEITVLKKDRVTYTIYTYVGVEVGDVDTMVVRDIVDSMRFI